MYGCVRLPLFICLISNFCILVEVWLWSWFYMVFNQLIQNDIVWSHSQEFLFTFMHVICLWCHVFLFIVIFVCETVSWTSLVVVQWQKCPCSLHETLVWYTFRVRCCTFLSKSDRCLIFYLFVCRVVGGFGYQLFYVFSCSRLSTA